MHIGARCEQCEECLAHDVEAELIWFGGAVTTRYMLFGLGFRFSRIVADGLPILDESFVRPPLCANGKLRTLVPGFCLASLFVPMFSGFRLTPNERPRGTII